MNKTYITFGSISGYIGVYDKNQKTLTYDNIIYDELIREMEVDENSENLRAMVGDQYIILINFENKQEFGHQKLSYDKVHDKVYCPNMISFIRNECALLAYFPTPNSERPYLMLRGEKPSSLHIAILEKHVTTLYNFEPAVNRDNLPVPMDFNGRSIMWLEYEPKQVQKIKLYDCTGQKETVIEIPQKEKTKLSHLKFFINDSIIFVRSAKSLYCFTKDKLPGEFLYSHDYAIMSYCFDDEKIVSIDAWGIIKICNIETKNIQTINLTHLPNYPMIAVNYKLFDMGYPYYICLNDNCIALTTDLGLFILQIP